MKVIDLLNKIANGEEVPKKVSINAGIHGIDTWVYDEHYEDYKNGANEMLLYSGMTSNHLNDEVEIIEEDKKIRKIKLCYSPDIDEEIFYEDGDKPNHCILGDAGTKLLINKINEIIDKINGGTNENTRN